MKMKFKNLCSLSLSIALLSLSACNNSGASDPSITGTNATGVSQSNGSLAPRSYSTGAMLFVGSGTWSSEVSSIRNILTSHGATYQEVNSAQLNAMSVDDLSKFGVLIFPGGSGGTEAGSVSAQTHANLRTAVQQNGVSYIGFCAGAFIAQAPAPAAGRDVSYGFGVVDGPVLDYYYLENQGTDIAMTLLSFPNGSKMDILWYGGPVTPNTGVIAKYPNGDPAISQLVSGNGFVILSAVHPTATSAILSSLGVSSSDGTHTDFAWTLISSAMTRQPLAAF